MEAERKGHLPNRVLWLSSLKHLAMLTLRTAARDPWNSFLEAQQTRGPMASTAPWRRSRPCGMEWDHMDRVHCFGFDMVACEYRIASYVNGLRAPSAGSAMRCPGRKRAKTKNRAPKLM